MKKWLIGSLVVLHWGFVNSVAALPAVDAPKVSLNLACDVGDDNCFETFQDMLPWIWDTRAPTEAKPLLVEIGPGTHVIGRILNETDGYYPLILCKNDGNVTFRGAGIDNTVITGFGGNTQTPEFPVFYGAVIKVNNCDNLTFESMSIRVDVQGWNGEGAVNHGISWNGGGRSVWSNVAVEANMYGWVDQCSGTGDTSEHLWFGSTITTKADGPYYQIGYRSDCGDTRFYGGEIRAIRSGQNAAAASTLIGVEAGSSKGNVALYGTLVQAMIDENTGVNYNNHSAQPFVLGHGGLVAINSGTVHMHGGIVSALNKGSGSGVYGIRVKSGGRVHTPDTAFGLETTGAKERIIDEGGTVQSPFLWANGTTPPEIVSNSGADLFVETDCDTAGSCDGPGTETHLMIYNSSCAGDPWFDSTTGRCRGVAAP